MRSACPKTTILRLVLSSFVLPAMAIASQAQAAPVVDGMVSVGEYGSISPSAVVILNPAAPESNFDSPTNEARVGYNIYQTSANGYYYGAVVVNSPNPNYAPSGIIGTFANLYFDLDPDANPGNGSDLGFEISTGGQRAFAPGINGTVDVSGIIVASGNNGTTLEYAIPVALFTAPIAGLTYDPTLTGFPSAGDPITLRLSQSFSYSVAGGATYGPDRLGRVTLAGADATVPEPASLLLLGTGMLGLGILRRRKTD